MPLPEDTVAVVDRREQELQEIEDNAEPTEASDSEYPDNDPEICTAEY